MLPIDQERCEVEAATHLQGKGYEPDLIFAAMINATMCFAVSNHGCAEAAEMTRELTERFANRHRCRYGNRNCGQRSKCWQ